MELRLLSCPILLFFSAANSSTYSTTCLAMLFFKLDVDVACIFVHLRPDHKNFLGAIVLHKVNWVKLVCSLDRAQSPSTLQSVFLATCTTNVVFGCLMWKIDRPTMTSFSCAKHEGSEQNTSATQVPGGKKGARQVRHHGQRTTATEACKGPHAHSKLTHDCFSQFAWSCPSLASGCIRARKRHMHTYRVSFLLSCGIFSLWWCPRQWPWGRSCRRFRL